ncbi:MAG TPA: 2-oxo acid dehydrogenase subunit E2, partial [Bacteroidales bacterium]|nr:2-oxo acid dehydrogenase subunit E2 [Bacteroidales bacterium]
MAIEIKVPSPGESITQVQIAKWLVADGEAVEKDQEVVEIDSDKASFPIAAPEEGVIHILVAEGETVAVGAVIATMEEIKDQKSKIKNQKSAPEQKEPNLPVAERKPEPEPPVTGVPSPLRPNVSPLARKVMEERKLAQADVQQAFPGKRITRSDIETFVRLKRGEGTGPAVETGKRTEERKKMTTLRLKLSERLVSVKNQTAMLTTFNEINMQQALRIKEKYADAFREKHGVGIGLMSLFTRAVTLALREFPQVNSYIDGEELVTPRYSDIGIAVSAPKGLVVPVLRNTESMSLAEIELKIKELAGKAR